MERERRPPSARSTPLPPRPAAYPPYSTYSWGYPPPQQYYPASQPYYPVPPQQYSQYPQPFSNGVSYPPSINPFAISPYQQAQVPAPHSGYQYDPSRDAPQVILPDGSEDGPDLDISALKQLHNVSKIEVSSLIPSIDAVAGVCEQVSKNLYVRAESARNPKDEILSTASELKVFSKILEDLRDALDSTSQMMNGRALDDVHAVLLSCENALTEVEKVIVPERRQAAKPRTWIRDTLNSRLAKAKATRLNLELCKTTLTVMISISRLAVVKNDARNAIEQNPLAPVFQKERRISTRVEKDILENSSTIERCHRAELEARDPALSGPSQYGQRSYMTSITIPSPAIQQLADLVPFQMPRRSRYLLLPGIPGDTNNLDEVSKARIESTKETLLKNWTTFDDTDQDVRGSRPSRSRTTTVRNGRIIPRYSPQRPPPLSTPSRLVRPGFAETVDSTATDGPSAADLVVPPLPPVYRERIPSPRTRRRSSSSGVGSRSQSPAEETRGRSASPRRGIHIEINHPRASVTSRTASASENGSDNYSAELYDVLQDPPDLHEPDLQPSDSISSARRQAPRRDDTRRQPNVRFTTDTPSPRYPRRYSPSPDEYFRQPYQSRIYPSGPVPPGQMTLYGPPPVYPQSYGVPYQPGYPPPPPSQGFLNPQSLPGGSASPYFPYGPPGPPPPASFYNPSPQPHGAEVPDVPEPPEPQRTEVELVLQRLEAFMVSQAEKEDRARRAAELAAVKQEFKEQAEAAASKRSAEEAEAWARRAEELAAVKHKIEEQAAAAALKRSAEEAAARTHDQIQQQAAAAAKANADEWKAKEEFFTKQLERVLNDQQQFMKDLLEHKPERQVDRPPPAPEPSLRSRRRARRSKPESDDEVIEVIEEHLPPAPSLSGYTSTSDDDRSVRSVFRLPTWHDVLSIADDAAMEKKWNEEVSTQLEIAKRNFLQYLIEHGEDDLDSALSEDDASILTVEHVDEDTRGVQAENAKSRARNGSDSKAVTISTKDSPLIDDSKEPFSVQANGELLATLVELKGLVRNLAPSHDAWDKNGMNVSSGSDLQLLNASGTGQESSGEGTTDFACM